MLWTKDRRHDLTISCILFLLSYFSFHSRESYLVAMIQNILYIWLAKSTVKSVMVKWSTLSHDNTSQFVCHTVSVRQNEVLNLIEEHFVGYVVCKFLSLSLSPPRKRFIICRKGNRCLPFFCDMEHSSYSSVFLVHWNVSYRNTALNKICIFYTHCIVSVAWKVFA